MASNVMAQVAGGSKQIVEDVETVRDLKVRLNAEAYTALVDGDPEGDDYVLEEGQLVTLAKAAKGGR